MVEKSPPRREKELAKHCYFDYIRGYVLKNGDGTNTLNVSLSFACEHPSAMVFRCANTSCEVYTTRPQTLKDGKGLLASFGQVIGGSPSTAQRTRAISATRKSYVFSERQKKLGQAARKMFLLWNATSLPSVKWRGWRKTQLCPGSMAAPTPRQQPQQQQPQEQSQQQQQQQQP